MKTKHTVLLTVFCSILFSAGGSTVTVQDAQNVALNFFKTVSKNTNPRTPLAANLKYTRTEPDGTVSLYAFDISPVKGFVIVSASDNDNPVIGYSTESFFDSDFSKTGLNEWLSRWGEEISYVEKNHITANPEAAMLWPDYRQGLTPATEKSLGVGPLCTTTWQQSNPVANLPVLYNEDCPYDMDAGTNTLAGCVATAMAQIMKYWNYPALGAGVASYSDEVDSGFSNNYGVLTFNFNTHPFNWAIMPDSLTGTSTSEQDSAVSLLSYACGVSVKMDYGTGESGASSLENESTNGASSQQAYPLYFKYNPNTIQGVLFPDYTTSSWIALIENELNQGRPVQYQGYNINAGGHTWVCDGYDANDMMHMNWGWGGMYDGWFAVTNLDPTYSFTYNIAALIGIEPAVQAIASPAVICSGDTSLLSVAGAPVAATYAWTPSTGLSCTTCSSPKASPGVTTTYRVSIDSAGNTVSCSVTVDVDQPHLLNYTLSDSQLCMGNSALLSLTGVSGISITPSSSVAWQDSLSALLTPDTGTIYHITTQSSVCGTGDSANLTVLVNPYLPVTLNLSANTICYGSNATLSYGGLTNISIAPSGYSYTGGPGIIIFDPDTTTGFFVSGTTSCGSVYNDTFTITVTPDNGALSYSLSKPTICRGDTSILTVSNATGVQVAPANMVTQLDNNTFLLTPDSNTTFYVSAYSAACGGQVSATIAVNIIQPGSLSYALAGQDLCVGGYEYIYLNGVTGNIQSNPLLYFYFSDSTNAYAYFVIDTTTTYSISASTLCGNGTANIEVKVLPPVSYSLQRLSICEGDSTMFTVLGLTGVSIYPPDGYRMVDSSHYEFYPSTTTVYQLNGNDCTGTSNNYSFTINVVQPGVFNYTLPDSNLCSAFGAELSLNGVYNPQITPYNYLYTTDSTDYYVYLYPTVTTAYTVSGESICGDSVSASFTVHVFPQAGYSIGTYSVCPGGSTTLKTTGLSNAAIYPNNTVTWVNDSVAVLSPATETDYVLSGTDCTGESNQYYILVSILPDTNTMYSVDSELCSGGQAYLTISGAYNIAVAPFVNLSYTDSFDAYAYLSPTVTTAYTITGTSQCTNASDTDVINVYLVENPIYFLSRPTVCNSDSVILETMGLYNIELNPNIDFSYYNSSSAYLYPDTTTTYTLSGISSCTSQPYNQSFTIAVDSVPSGAALNISMSHDTLLASSASGYQWLLNGNPIQDANMPFIIPATAGVYTVELGANGCITVSNPFTYTGVNNLTEDHDFEVYPNPTSATWMVQTNAPAKGNTCEIFDNEGRLVYRSMINSGKNEINTALSSGIYLMKILDEGQVRFIVKLVKL